MDDGEIAGSRSAFASALSRGDSRGASALYTEDARLLPPAAELVQGRAAIEAFWRAGIEVGIAHADYEALELHRQNGLAYEVGRYALRLRQADGGTMVDRGDYVLVHERQADGSWRRAVEMFSPDDMRTASTVGGRT
jgi:ketosteroid isomerase-like protein